MLKFVESQRVGHDRVTFTSLKTIIRTKEQKSVLVSTIFLNTLRLGYYFFIRSKAALHASTMQSMKNYINAKTISQSFNRGDGIEILKRNDLYLAFLWHYRNDWNFFF